jgi:hypothetical protein
MIERYGHCDGLEGYRMKDNKLTPEEVKKALECCTHSKWGDKCAECFYCECDSEKGCQRELIEDTLDLINSQQEEIERLTINMNAFGLGMKQEKERADTIRAEAIKEFAERLKERGFWDRTYHLKIYLVADINNLAIEMVGEDK